MNITGEQKLLAILAHLAYLLGGLGFIIAPLVIFLLRKEDPFVYHHAKQALVAHLAILAASVITSLLCILLIGFLLVPVLALLWLLLLITSIIAAVKSADGQFYEYPLIQSLVHKL
ncbi:MAG TPA: DUF4870 domain-containing protein [Sporomusaceae bacterium]|jgi:uncharacterized Tic20 family protein|uniref:DUF4870 domain-containing protein n=1 Tax=Anaerospora sp. TaxID=1960278 RepID=UPI000ED9CCA8|nr:DUF4870 domain-containing protein [Anaerospora sp.]HAK74789.1 DUF4870 domain-containing protein [Sporomusaceae bacterium]